MNVNADGMIELSDEEEAMVHRQCEQGLHRSRAHCIAAHWGRWIQEMQQMRMTEIAILDGVPEQHQAHVRLRLSPSPNGKAD